MYQNARQRGVGFFPLDVVDPYALTADEHQGFVEELLAQEIDALIARDPSWMRALIVGITATVWRWPRSWNGA